MMVTYLIHPATMTYLPGDYRTMMRINEIQGGGFWYTHTANTNVIDAELQAQGYKRMSYEGWSTAVSLQEATEELARWSEESKVSFGKHGPRYWTAKRFARQQVAWWTEVVNHLAKVRAA